MNYIFFVPLQAEIIKTKRKMKHSYALTFLLMLLFCSVGATAQRRVGLRDTSAVVQRYMDSLQVYKSRLDSMSKENEALRKENYDGRYYRLFVPTTFYHSVANKQLSLSSLGYNDQVVNTVDSTLMVIYLKRPDLLVNSENRLKAVGSIRNDVDVQQTQQIELAEQVAPVPEETPVAPADEGIMIKKPNFWTFKGDYFLQFLQNYITSNWHKGGESNYSMLASLTLEANYYNKQKVKWDNKLEMKLGILSTEADTINKFKTTDDLIRYTTQLSLQAYKKWYYAAQLIASTQFTKGRKNNDPNIYSDFMSPFTLNLSLGMNYVVDIWNKKLTGNILLAPLSYYYTYVDRLALATRFGVDEGKHSLHDIGSLINIGLVWKPADNIKWETRFYTFSNYSYAQLEWENTINFQFNRYISTKLSFYPRFDDHEERTTDTYWQLKEFLSIGFAYSM